MWHGISGGGSASCKSVASPDVALRERHENAVLRRCETSGSMQTAEYENVPMDVACAMLCEEIHALARALARAELSRDDFIAAILQLENERARPLGFTLVGSHTRDDWTHFSLRFRGTHQICASFEFLPDTGEFRNEYQCGRQG